MKKKIIRIACAQINCTVGDLAGNKDKILRSVVSAKAMQADIVVFPELAITGYPPEDLLLKPQFIQDNLDVLKDLALQITGITAVIGFVDRKTKDIFNAAAIIHDGKVKAVYHKMLLPNYGVFDEERYFTAGDRPLVLSLGRVNFAVNICEDIWHSAGPLKKQVASGAQLIININASPYHLGKIREREKIICAQAKAYNVPIIYMNLVGGQDELVFDGHSMVIDRKGKIIQRLEVFDEDFSIVDLEVDPAKNAKKAGSIKITQDWVFRDKTPVSARTIKPYSQAEEVYRALSLGLKDYVFKNGFKKVAVGLSGGIDSALVASIAADCLGRDNVIGIFMPTRYSSLESEVDARQLAGNLGIEFKHISIEQIYNMFLLVLEPHFAGYAKDIAEENIQARIRGTLMMAFSNKFGWLVLTTGNKSEMSTGYATLYGDMAGGFALIKDVPKTLVYELAAYRNTIKPVIPQRIFTKAPTAELRPNQKDSDSLPEYKDLDPIVKAYVEEDKSLSQITATGVNEAVVQKVLNLVDKSEYKRRQSPPGIKITPRAFGKDRRMPITNKYRG